MTLTAAAAVVVVVVCSISRRSSLICFPRPFTCEINEKNRFPAVRVEWQLVCHMLLVLVTFNWEATIECVKERIRRRRRRYKREKEEKKGYFDVSWPLFSYNYSCFSQFGEKSRRKRWSIWSVEMTLWSNLTQAWVFFGDEIATD